MYPDLLTVAVVDDRSLAGTHEDIAEAVEVISTYDKLAGHALNQSKCAYGSLSGKSETRVEKDQSSSMKNMSKFKTGKVAGEIITLKPTTKNEEAKKRMNKTMKMRRRS